MEYLQDMNINLHIFPHTGKDNISLGAIFRLGEHIMSKISDFAAAQNAFNDQMDAAVAGLSGDIATLNDTIAKIQASSGAVSVEDQASLDVLTARGKVIADKLTALDQLTAPVPPTV